MAMHRIVAIMAKDRKVHSLIKASELMLRIGELGQKLSRPLMIMETSSLRNRLIV